MAPSVGSNAVAKYGLSKKNKEINLYNYSACRKHFVLTKRLDTLICFIIDFLCKPTLIKN
jgi:hypothetical protein